MSLSKKAQDWLESSKKYFHAKRKADCFQDRAQVRLLEAEMEECAAKLYKNPLQKNAALVRAQRCREYSKAILEANGRWYNEEYLQDEVWRRYKDKKITFVN